MHNVHTQLTAIFCGTGIPIEILTASHIECHTDAKLAHMHGTSQLDSQSNEKTKFYLILFKPGKVNDLRALFHNLCLPRVCEKCSIRSDLTDISSAARPWELPCLGRCPSTRDQMSTRDLAEYNSAVTEPWLPVWCRSRSPLWVSIFRALSTRLTSV